MIDIVIVGAGPSGLCAAKTFLQHDARADVVIVDAQKSLGGVWSREQIYATLKTNNLWSAVDFTDFPMDERFGARPGEHVSGQAMHAYYRAYAEDAHLVDRIRLETRVVGVSRRPGGDGWCVSVTTSGRGGEVLECARLVVATGVLSEPHMPDVRGADEFGVPLIHSSELGPQSRLLASEPDVETVAVLGGAKSAYDAVYFAATTGHKVEWIIRRSGRGPAWVFPPHTQLGPFKAWRERLITRRIMSFMSPSIFPDHSGLGWLKSFLHFSAVGKAICRKFWSLIHHDTINDCGYRARDGVGILEPEQNPFWYGTQSGTLSYDQDFFSFVRSGQVRIHREDVSHLSERTVHLGDGTSLGVDMLVAATGFSAKPNVSFEPPSMHSDLGVPTTALDEAQKDFWADVDARADRVIQAQFPRLIAGPFKAPGSGIPAPFNPGMAAEVTYTPWRLYRGIAPPGLTAVGDRSLVFLGMFSNIANTMRLEVQCLWALAYFSGKLRGIDADVKEGRIFEETAELQRWAQHRAPYGHGRFYPDLNFDQLPYWDVLLNDLGLPTRRKPNALRELFEPYRQEDYRGLVKDWVQRNG